MDIKNIILATTIWYSMCMCVFVIKCWSNTIGFCIKYIVNIFVYTYSKWKWILNINRKWNYEVYSEEGIWIKVCLFFFGCLYFPPIDAFSKASRSRIYSLSLTFFVHLWLAFLQNIENGKWDSFFKTKLLLFYRVRTSLLQIIIIRKGGQSPTLG